MEWGNKILKEIVGGKNADGSSMLESFLKDYSQLIGIKLSSLQPSCPNCLQRYYNEYILKTGNMENSCDYKLQKMFNGLPLEFGSSVFVHNGNITNEYAEKLISRYLDAADERGEEWLPDAIFAQYPDNWEDAHYPTEEEIAAAEAAEKAEKEAAEKAEKAEKGKVLELNKEKSDESLSFTELKAKYEKIYPELKANGKANFLEKLKEFKKQ